MAAFQGGGEIILWLLVLLSCVLNHERVDARGLSPQEEDLELERQLNTINKPAIKTFSMGNGDTVDCVDIYKQPAFDHPLLKDHKVQLDQNFTGSSIRRAESELKEPYRLASLELVECPEGTVPIRRIRKEELRNHNMNLPTLQMPSQEANLFPGYYAVRATGIGRFKGAHVGLSIHELANVKPNQFSSSLFILWGNDPSAMGDAMFIGWLINPDLYGDTKPRFTIYFQSGGRGCFNLLCPGFVYTSKKYYLGSTFSLQYGPGVVNVITLDYLMSESGPPRWQIVTKDHTLPGGYDVLGYWPAEILKNFPDNNAARVAAGGFVSSPPNEKSPPMGNGDWPTDGRQFAAFVRSVCYLKEDFKQDCIFDKDEFINFGFEVNTDPRCYGLGKMLLNDDLEGHFYYGGPGGCPP